MVSKIDSIIMSGVVSLTLISCGGNLKSGTQEAVLSSNLESIDNTGSNSGEEASQNPGVNPFLPSPTNNSNYIVYLGCSEPINTFTRTIYVDASLGSDTNTGSLTSPYKTLSNLVSKKLIQSGDHVIIKKGNYGGFSITKANYLSLVGNTKWIWLDFESGAELQGLNISDVSKMIITGATIYKATGDIVSLINSQDIVLANNLIYSSALNPTSLTASQWMALANGVVVRNGTCNSVYQNTLRNLRFGITALSDNKTYPANSQKALFEENDMRGFSGDASRGIGSDLIFRNNSFIDGYVSAADGDNNHDDMFQGFALDGAIYENLLIEGNLMIDRSSVNRPLQADYQGIAIFDGLYKNVIVRNNKLITGLWHGISMYGLQDVIIENNTVVNSSIDPSRSVWIGLFNSKTGVKPINNIVRNNLADQFSGSNLATNFTNNFVISNPVNSFVAFDFSTSIFDLNLKTTDPAYGKSAGAN